jgi:hypothetical protein
VQVGEQYAEILGIRAVPLTDAWALRRFAVCFARRCVTAPSIRPSS